MSLTKATQKVSFRPRKPSQTHRYKEKLASIKFYEYAGAELVDGVADYSLHSKVMIFGDDIYVGSANADPRSLMMDTNNGLFLRNVPEVVSSYRQYLNELRRARKHVRPITTLVQSITLAEMLSEDKIRLAQAVKKLLGGGELPAEAKLALEKASGLLTRIHGDVESGLRDRRDRGPLADYDRYLKFL